MRASPPTGLARDRALPGRMSDGDPGTSRPRSPDGHAAEHRAIAGAVSRRRLAAMTRTKHYVAVYERDTDSDAWLVHIKGIAGLPHLRPHPAPGRGAYPRGTRGLARPRSEHSEITSEWPERSRRSRRGRGGPSRSRRLLTRSRRRDCESGEEARPHGPQPPRHRRRPRISHQRVQQLLAVMRRDRTPRRSERDR